MAVDVECGARLDRNFNGGGFPPVADADDSHEPGLAFHPYGRYVDACIGAVSDSGLRKGSVALSSGIVVPPFPHSKRCTLSDWSHPWIPWFSSGLRCRPRADHHTRRRDKDWPRALRDAYRSGRGIPLSRVEDAGRREHLAERRWVPRAHHARDVCRVRWPVMTTGVAANPTCIVVVLAPRQAENIHERLEGGAR